MKNKLYWTSIAFTALGLAVSLYMTILKYWGGERMCIGNGGCQTVSESPYAIIAGVPVAVFGIIGYLALLVMLVLELRGGKFFKKNATLLTFGMAVLGFVFTLYLVYLEIFVIKALCPFCLTSQITMTILFILAVIRLVKQPIN